MKTIRFGPLEKRQQLRITKHGGVLTCSTDAQGQETCEASLPTGTRIRLFYQHGYATQRAVLFPDGEGFIWFLYEKPPPKGKWISTMNVPKAGYIQQLYQENGWLKKPATAEQAIPLESVSQGDASVSG